MAQVVWREKASVLLEEHLEYALIEFGRKTVSNWYKDILRIESRLAMHPESFTPEPLLAHRGKVYRGAILMKNLTNAIIMTRDMSVAQGHRPRVSRKENGRTSF